MPSMWQDMSQLQETALLPEHVLVMKESPWDNGRRRRENDCEPPLFVGAVTIEVQIQNDECYVTHAAKSGHWFASEHNAT